MLEKTFFHVKGIAINFERLLWERDMDQKTKDIKEFLIQLILELSD